MAEYIEREAVLAEYDRQHQGTPGGAREIIAEWPAADVVPVVRCKDCRNWTEHGLCRSWSVYGSVVTIAEGYCHRGVRKDG